MLGVEGSHNIYKISDDKFHIRKTINGKPVYFGVGHSLEEAFKIRDWCEEHDWSMKYPCLIRRLPFEEDYNMINDICNERNVKKKTRETYFQTVKHYTKFLNKSLTDLLEKYLSEEEELPWKKRTLKKHLISYRNYLYNTYMGNSAKMYFSRLLTLLRHCEIELSYLPYLNKTNVKDLPPITHKDLLTKEELEKCYGAANPMMKAIILFQTSSGCARRETLNLTIRDYLEANTVNIINKPVKSLLLKVNPENIPGFKLLRQKTNKYYFTYCSPQANQEILDYLINREDKLTLDSPVFNCNLYYWNLYYNEINDKLELGKARGYNRFRSHMLRKYHASTLYNNGLSMDDVDSLQGRSKDSTHRSYFMDDPELLKRKYVEHMDSLILDV